MMANKLRQFVIISLILIAIFLIGCSSKPTKYDTFAQCLTEKDVTMYGTDWCSHCKNQKKMFGKSFKYVNYVDCDWNKDECLKAGVSGYPTWKINGTNYPGEQPLYRLASLSGCDLIEDEQIK